MVGRMDGLFLPTTQGIKFIRRSRSWKRGSSRLLPSVDLLLWQNGLRWCTGSHLFRHLEEATSWSVHWPGSTWHDWNWSATESSLKSDCSSVLSVGFAR